MMNLLVLCEIEQTSTNTSIRFYKNFSNTNLSMVAKEYFDQESQQIFDDGNEPSNSIKKLPTGFYCYHVLDVG